METFVKILSVTLTHGSQGACLVLLEIIRKCDVKSEDLADLLNKISVLLTKPMLFDEVSL